MFITFLCKLAKSLSDKTYFYYTFHSYEIAFAFIDDD